jgi:hypothetical protein
MFWKAVASKERLEKLKAQIAVMQQQQSAAEAALVAVLTEMGLDLSKPVDFDYQQERVVNSSGDGQPV